MFRVDMSKFKPNPSFTADGFNTYAIRIKVIGIENSLYILSPGNYEEEAIDCAIATVAMLKTNDVQVKDVILTKETDND